MQNKTFSLKTYGCQMNVYDSDRIEDILTNMHYTKTENNEDADIVIFNTCHIREKATERLYSELGKAAVNKIERLKNTGKKTCLVVCGCIAQAEQENIFKRQRHVDIVIGTQAYHSLQGAVESFFDNTTEEVDKNKENVFNLNNTSYKENYINYIAVQNESEKKLEYFSKINKYNSNSAFVSIQEGCNKFCTYCVVPHTRGREFCRQPEEIIEEINKIKQTVSEIVFLGQNVNDYKVTDKRSGKLYVLSDLIREVSKIDEILRINYTTSHPINMTDDLIDCYKDCDKLMSILHLPVQAGSDKILKKMNRKHSIDLYYNVIQKLRLARPDIIFSSDFIVGFPMETDADFRDTIKLVNDIKYNAQSFSFIYSRRPNTTACIMRESVDTKVAMSRLYELQDLLNDQKKAFNASCVGKTMQVLINKTDKSKPDTIFGKSQYMQHIQINNSKNEIGSKKIVNVKIHDFKNGQLSGSIL